MGAAAVSLCPLCHLCGDTAAAASHTAYTQPYSVI